MCGVWCLSVASHSHMVFNKILIWWITLKPYGKNHHVNMVIYYGDVSLCAVCGVLCVVCIMVIYFGDVRVQCFVCVVGGVWKCRSKNDARDKNTDARTYDLFFLLLFLWWGLYEMKKLSWLYGDSPYKNKNRYISLLPHITSSTRKRHDVTLGWLAPTVTCYFGIRMNSNR